MFPRKCKNSLKLLTSNIIKIIKNELNEVTNVSRTRDCWTFRSQESYITIICHTIICHTVKPWILKSFTLRTHEVD